MKTLILTLLLIHSFTQSIFAQIREYGRVGELQICTYIKLPNGELKPEPAQVQIFVNGKELGKFQTQVRDGKILPIRLFNFNKGVWLFKWQFEGKPKEGNLQRDNLNPENFNITLNE
jgi:hypothetical protein